MKTDRTALSPIVAGFAVEMQDALDRNSHKSGWEDLSPKWLLHRLRQETKELERALEKLDTADPYRKDNCRAAVDREAADVANFAMFIAANFGEQT